MNKTTRNALLLTGLVLAGRALLQKCRRADLTDQVVLITGGSRGLGLALAAEFAKHGARLALCARDPQELARAREMLAGQGADAFTVVCDLTDPVQVARLIADVTAHYERILSLPANLLARAHGLAPSATSGLLTLINNAVLPPPSDQPEGYISSPGKDVAPDVPARPLFEAATGLGRAAAERLNQNPDD